MKACSKAINISKHTIQQLNRIGTIPRIPSAATNPAIIFSIMCPTVILATRRTVRLNGFDKKEIISIGMINGANAKGIPLGKKVLNQPIFFFLMPIIMLKTRAIIDRLPTAVKCDVNVKAYGNNPKRLPNATNVNKQKIKGKYFSPSIPTFSFNNE